MTCPSIKKRLVRDCGKKKHLFGVIQQDHTEPPAQGPRARSHDGSAMKEDEIMLYVTMLLNQLKKDAFRFKDEDGAALIEYTVLLGILLGAVIGVIGTVAPWSTAIGTRCERSSDRLGDAANRQPHEPCGDAMPSLMNRDAPAISHAPFTMIRRCAGSSAGRWLTGT